MLLFPMNKQTKPIIRFGNGNSMTITVSNNFLQLRVLDCVVVLYSSACRAETRLKREQANLLTGISRAR